MHHVAAGTSESRRLSPPLSGSNTLQRRHRHPAATTYKEDMELSRPAGSAKEIPVQQTEPRLQLVFFFFSLKKKISATAMRFFLQHAWVFQGSVSQWLALSGRRRPTAPPVPPPRGSVWESKVRQHRCPPPAGAPSLTAFFKKFSSSRKKKSQSEFYWTAI